MEMKTNMLYLLGCGPGAADMVTLRVKNIANQADLLIGCARTQAMFPESTAERILHDNNISQLLELAARALENGRKIAWLCTGDSTLFSIAQVVRSTFGSERSTVIPGVSSVQVACAALNARLDQVLITSAHGRTWKYQTEYNQKHLCVLAGGTDNLDALIACGNALQETHTCFVCADLTLPTEVITEIRPSELADWITHPLLLLFWRKCD
ncbi:MAG: precorrin-6y C5,15-methyltransferase (decarboxylating) subunit CbiE [Fibrobacter sp.]|nr:precorrin-6y C5,15-methyltransferase (decarboxylating) subunit CbiE [Fibrobacter sp.]